MIFKEVNKFERIVKFKNKNAHSFFLKEEVIIYFFENEQIFDEKIKTSELFILNDGILILDKSRHGKLFEIKEKKLDIKKVLDVEISEVSEKNELAFYSKWLNYYPIEIENGIFDLNKAKVIWTNLNYNCHIYFDNLFLFRDQLFSKLDFNTGQPFWEYQYANEPTFLAHNEPKKVEIRRFLGIYNNELWVALNSGVLLGIDINTGELLHRLRESVHCPDSYKAPALNEYSNFGEYAQLDSESGKIIGLRYYNYWVIDLKNPTEAFYYYDVSNEFKKHGLRAESPGYENALDGEYIYFADSQQAILGAFNRALQTIDWTYSLNLPEKGINKIHKLEYHEGRLYVHDIEGTLHIFEKE